MGYKYNPYTETWFEIRELKRRGAANLDLMHDFNLSYAELREILNVPSQVRKIIEEVESNDSDNN